MLEHIMNHSSKFVQALLRFPARSRVTSDKIFSLAQAEIRTSIAAITSQHRKKTVSLTSPVSVFDCIEDIVLEFIPVSE